MNKVEIGRQSLALIGRSSIETFDEDSPEARQVRIWYDPSRRECLESHNFSFSRKVDFLATHPTAPNSGWSFRYKMPGDSLKVWKVMYEGNKKSYPYEISVVGEEQTIQTNVEKAVAQYTFDLQVAELFSPSFTKGLRYLIAHYIAPNLNGEIGIKKAEEYLKASQAFLLRAAASDANGEQDRDDEEPEVLSVRSGA